MAIRFYYLAEEFARGNWRHNQNGLRWDMARINLPANFESSWRRRLIP
jgi:hypothetical protein